MNKIINLIKSFESWFNKEFGWFFTNGNKIK
jgi:hypothetical protein